MFKKGHLVRVVDTGLIVQVVGKPLILNLNLKDSCLLKLLQV